MIWKRRFYTFLLLALVALCMIVPDYLREANASPMKDKQFDCPLTFRDPRDGAKLDTLHQGRILAYPENEDTTGNAQDNLLFVGADTTWKHQEIAYDSYFYVFYNDTVTIELEANFGQVGPEAPEGFIGSAAVFYGPCIPPFAMMPDSEYVGVKEFGADTIAAQGLLRGPRAQVDTLLADSLIQAMRAEIDSLKALSGNWIQLLDSLKAVAALFVRGAQVTETYKGHYTLTSQDSANLLSNPYITRVYVHDSLDVSEPTRCGWYGWVPWGYGAADRPLAVGCSCSVADSLDINVGGATIVGPLPTIWWEFDDN